MSEQTLDLRPRNIAQAIEGMAFTFNPAKAKDLNATIQFRVSGEEGGDWYLAIADGVCRCQRGVSPNPTMTITTSAAAWLAIARGEMKGSVAFMTGKYKVKGRADLLLRFDSIFSREPTVEDIASKGWLKE